MGQVFSFHFAVLRKILPRKKNIYSKPITETVEKGTTRVQI